MPPSGRVLFRLFARTREYNGRALLRRRRRRRRSLIVVGTLCRPRARNDGTAEIVANHRAHPMPPPETRRHNNSHSVSFKSDRARARARIPRGAVP